MSELNELPACRVWWIERHLVAHDARYCMLEGRDDSDGELAFVVRLADPETWPEPTNPTRERGFATLTDGVMHVEWVTSPRQAARVFSSALRRLGWKRSIHASDVYGAGN